MQLPTFRSFLTLPFSFSKPFVLGPSSLPGLRPRWPIVQTNPRQTSHLSSSSGHQPPRPTQSRGPVSSETTQTDFASLDMLGSMPAPTTAIDTCLEDGFDFNNGLRIAGGSGCLLIAGEAFRWRPWEVRERNEARGARWAMINKMGHWEVEKEAWGLLELVWPKPGRHQFSRWPFNVI